jgi:hypothetical protein
VGDPHHLDGRERLLTHRINALPGHASGYCSL